MAELWLYLRQYIRPQRVKTVMGSAERWSYLLTVKLGQRTSYSNFHLQVGQAQFKMYSCSRKKEDL